jgi:hypothetical protein
MIAGPQVAVLSWKSRPATDFLLLVSYQLGLRSNGLMLQSIPGLGFCREMP